MLTKLINKTHLRLRAKLLWLAVGGITVTTLSLIAVGFWQGNVFNAQAQKGVDTLTSTNLDHITQGVYNLIQTQDQTLQQQVSDDINVARYALNDSGGVSLSTRTVAWNAVNQVNQESINVELPEMLVGGKWLGQNTDPLVEVPVVDKIRELVGGTATVFQRMNARGDLLSVATNEAKQDGKRAIGTYLPAVNPDGTPNPAVSALIKGETYQRLVPVGDNWFITAYEPILSSSGEMIGALNVTVKPESIAALRQAITSIKVGQTGYVYILGGTGDLRGHYIISKNDERDGENIWDAQDAQGDYFIQSIVEKALTLKPGEFATQSYPWQNPGEAQPRWKIARIAYYAPWDWVIGVGAYEDEFSVYQANLQTSRNNMIYTFGIVGLVFAVLGGLLANFFASGISKPVQVVTHAAREIANVDLSNLASEMNRLADGDLTRSVSITGQEIDIQTGDEIGLMAEAFNTMIARLHEIGGTFDQMSANLRNLVGQVAENANSLGVSSSQLATASGQTSQVTSQIAMTVQQVASGITQQTESATRTAIAVEQMTRAIDGVAGGAQEQAQAVTLASNMMAQLSQTVEEIRLGALDQSEQMSQAVSARSAMSQAISKVVEAIGQMATETEQSARSAAEGTHIASQTVQGMERVRTTTEQLAQRVRDLGKRSSQIETIVETIDDIASQTNLLALNAAIEAARAGVHGKGFAVVADEVRKLAERSAQATKETANMLRSVQSGADEVVVAMQHAGEDVSSATALTDQAGVAFQEIASGTRASSERVQAIRDAIQSMQTASEQLEHTVSEAGEKAERNLQAVEEMSRLNNQMVESLDSVSAVVEENTAATEEMAASSSEVSDAIDNIASVSEENSAAIEQVSASSEEMSAQAEEVSASAQSLAEMAQTLTLLVSRFNLGGDQGSEMQLELFKQAHLNWVKRLKDMLDGKIRLQASEVISATECTLGMWYSQAGQKHYGDLPEFKAIENPHIRIHNKTAEVVEAFNRGNFATARAGMKEVELLSREIVEALGNLEMRIINRAFGPTPPDPLSQTSALKPASAAIPVGGNGYRRL